MSKIPTFFFLQYLIFNRSLGVTTKAGTKYVEEKRGENIVVNRVVTWGQAGLVRQV